MEISVSLVKPRRLIHKENCLGQYLDKRDLDLERKLDFLCRMILVSMRLDARNSMVASG